MKNFVDNYCMGKKLCILSVAFSLILVYLARAIIVNKALGI